MTRREWEEELKKHLIGLPLEETVKVLDYYEELYEDKRELGLKAVDIINEFGNPIDVAGKILEENRLNKLEQSDKINECKEDMQGTKDGLKTAEFNKVKIDNKDLFSAHTANNCRAAENKYANSVNAQKPKKGRCFLINAVVSVVNFCLWCAIILFGIIFFSICIGLILGGIAGFVMTFDTGTDGAALYFDLGVFLLCTSLGVFMTYFTKGVIKLCKRFIKKLRAFVNARKVNYIDRRNQYES